jgi:hypothetical protein
MFTVARWPIFRPNNSKHAQKIFLAEKSWDRKMADFVQKWQKKAGKTFVAIYTVGEIL